MYVLNSINNNLVSDFEFFLLIQWLLRSGEGPLALLNKNYRLDLCFIVKEGLFHK